MIIAERIALVRPSAYGSNAQTLASNAFQKISSDEDIINAASQFERVIQTLKDSDIAFEFFQASSNSVDAIFPNNWFSTFPNRRLLTYPMLAENRREEREDAIIERLIAQGYTHDARLQELEKTPQPLFLEGTGSLVLDHSMKIGFACLSSRTSEEAIKAFEQLTGYEVVRFCATDEQGLAIYHTNVMMSLGEGYVLMGLDTIPINQQKDVMEKLAPNREIVLLSNEQTFNHFAANVLQVLDKNGRKCLLCSERAFRSYSPRQIKLLEKHNDHIIAFDISSIEKLGGGSLRCMLAELF